MDHSKSISTTQGALSVKRCGCGGIHVCIGGVSLNLAPETALYLQAELQKACFSVPAAAQTVPVIPLRPKLSVEN